MRPPLDVYLIIVSEYCMSDISFTLQNPKPGPTQVESIDQEFQDSQKMKQIPGTAARWKSVPFAPEKDNILAPNGSDDQQVTNKS